MRSVYPASSALLLVLACSGGGGDPQQQADSQQVAGATPAGPALGEEAPDRPAPVAGAYLTCMIQNPKPDDTEYVAGCQLRDKTAKPIALRNEQTRWTYKPDGKNALTSSDVAVTDLSKLPQDYYFQVVYKVKKSSGLTLKAGIDPKLAAFALSSPCLTSKVATGCGAPLGRQSNAFAKTEGQARSVYEAKEGSATVVVPPKKEDAATVTTQAEVQQAPAPAPPNQAPPPAQPPLIVLNPPPAQPPPPAQSPGGDEVLVIEDPAFDPNAPYDPNAVVVYELVPQKP